jgi:copper homeostasis protein
MNFEICTDTVEGIIAAEKYGIQRIELCSALSVGGLTPSTALIQKCCEKSNVEVHVMIRHREGGFIYTMDDIDLMKIDIKIAKNAGAHGVVFGVLNTANEVSVLNKELVVFAKTMGLEVTFHRAFDLVKDYSEAIEELISYGFDRLLTSGLQPSAEQGLPVITYLQEKYGKKIQIMAGAGISATNAKLIASSGIENLHFTARKSERSSVKLSMGEFMIVDEEKIENIVNQFK